MTFSGDLRDISLADVFQNIAANRRSGTLRVQWRNTERFVMFEDGAVAGFSLGVRQGLPISEHLVQRGYVDQTALDRVKAKTKRSRKALGRRVVQAKLMTEEAMTDVVAELIAENVYDLVLQRNAEFDFTVGNPPPQVFGADQQAFPVRLEASALLVEGARRRDEWERINRVVSSDRDLFLLLEGWEDCEIGEFTATIAQLLDGQTDVTALVEHVGRSRFDVTKSISELVIIGAARPCTAQEIEESARDALEAGDSDAALRFLQHALELERSNTELRHEYADLLEQLGRDSDAASEHALLGYQAGRDGETETARSHYDRAVSLSPADPVLHEQRVDLLQESGAPDELTEAVLKLSDIWLSMGLAERARDILAQALGRKDLNERQELLERLAEIEARLGRLDDCATTYQRLAEMVAQDDELRAADYLRRGLGHCPENDNLKKRLVDIQSGQRTRRQHRRRQVLGASAAATVLLAFASAGVAELAASRQVVRVLDEGLDSISRGQSAPTISNLQELRDDYGWTPSGHRAAVLLRRLVGIQLQTAREFALAGDSGRALALIAEIESLVVDSPLVADCTAMRREIETQVAAPPR